MRARPYWLPIALGLAGCAALDPTSFDVYRHTAGIVVSTSPGGGNGATGFGSVVVGFDTMLQDPTTRGRVLDASRFVASGGAGGPYAVYAAFDELPIDMTSTAGLRPTAQPGARYLGCVNGQLCGAGSSASFASAPVWHPDAVSTQFGCVIAPSGRVLVSSSTGVFQEQLQIRCETTSGAIQPMPIPMEGLGLGASATTLPVEHPLGAAIFGAPLANGGDGGLFRVDDYPLNTLIPVGLTGTPAGAGIGAVLASVALADGTILVATSGRERPDDPVVVVATLDPAGGTELRACLRGRGSHFGSALTFGQFDGDALPDLVVGAGVSGLEEAAGQRTDTPLALYAGSALLSARAAGCESPPTTALTPGRTLDCTSDTAHGFVCAVGTGDAYTGFGAALAAGDVNGDHVDDLVVGAPFSSAMASTGGALVVLVGGSTFDALGATDHSILSYATVGTGARLGTAVATVTGADRDEIVAGAPGQGHVALFFCSGVRGDRPEDFAGMSGVTHGCVVGPHTHTSTDAGVAGDGGGAQDAGDLDAGVDAGGDDAGGDDAGIVDDAGRGMDVDADVDAG